MRRWDWDGIPVPEATEFGEFILKVSWHQFHSCWEWEVHTVYVHCRAMRFTYQASIQKGGSADSEEAGSQRHPSLSAQCGMARHPNTPLLLISHANFCIEVRGWGGFHSRLDSLDSLDSFVLIAWRYNCDASFCIEVSGGCKQSASACASSTLHIDCMALTAPFQPP